ncbi:MAG: superinfection immunity protein [Rickettsiales bacterium]|jgi:hypothetical protein|nr:superinfection immunity protein [Rickettsiales bacterium]
MHTLRLLLCIAVFAGLFILPVHLAGLAKKEAYEMCRVRVWNLCFGWTIVGYFVALYFAVQKNPE